MKQIFFLLLLSFFSCTSQEFKNLDHMNPVKWEADVNQLNDIIQNEFKTFQPELKDKFDSNTKQLISELNQLSNEEITIRLGQLIVGLENGHTEISAMQRVANFKRMPLAMYIFNDSMYIYGAQKKYQHIIGTRVVKIGRKTLDEILSALKTIMTHDNHYEILYAGTTFMLSPEVLKFLDIIDDMAQVQFELEDSSGRIIHETIIPLSIAEYKAGDWVSYTQMNAIQPTLSQKNQGKDYWYKYIAEHNAMYMYFGQVNNQKGEPSLKKFFKNMFKEIDNTKAQKLIVDLRYNTGGDNSKSKPLIEAIKKHPYLNKEGRVYVITGRMTFSAAMATAVFLKRQTNAILIGEPSRGNPNKSNNVEHKRLKNSGLLVEYTTRIIKHWPELGDLDHVPVDIEILKRFEHYQKGVDPVLEYIVKN
ncbi:S41 family peptidase [Winogradskyella sp.]|uniref:S41 family peptidase n=1 Tax=Winogradskyella sp. TaxID=1883156 RepID=UPI003BA9E59D